MLDCRLSDAVDLSVRLVAAGIGAQVDNMRLSDHLPDSMVEALKSALARHRVLFFRDQGDLDDAAQEAFTARLGELVAPPTYPARPGTIGILGLDSNEGRRADRWHSDGTFVAICCRRISPGLRTRYAGAGTLAMLRSGTTG